MNCNSCWGWGLDAMMRRISKDAVIAKTYLRPHTPCPECGSTIYGPPTGTRPWHWYFRIRLACWLDWLKRLLGPKVASMEDA